MIHAVYPALVSVQFFYQVASAPAQAFYDLVIKTRLMQMMHSLDILAAAPGITHICYYSFDVCVLHTLVISPSAFRRGLGRAFVEFYESWAKEHGFYELRIDTNVKNAGARAMYRKLGYKEIGVVPTVFNGIPDVNLVLLEKNLRYQG